MFPKGLILFVFAGFVLNLSNSKLIHDVIKVCDGVFILPEKIEKELVQPYVLNPVGNVSTNQKIITERYRCIYFHLLYRICDVLNCHLFALRSKG